MKNKFSYTNAIEEVDQILKEIESGELDVDQLSEKVEKALKLINKCKDKLRQTEDQLGNSFQDSESGKK